MGWSNDFGNAGLQLRFTTIPSPTFFTTWKQLHQFTCSLTTPAWNRKSKYSSPVLSDNSSLTNVQNRNKNKSKKQDHFRHRSWNPRLLVPMSAYWPSKTLGRPDKKLERFDFVHQNAAQPRRADTKFRISSDTFCQLVRVFWTASNHWLVPKVVDSNCGAENVPGFKI